MAKERSEILPEDKWNIEALYENLQGWEEDFSALQKEAEAKWPRLTDLKKKIHTSPDQMQAALDHLFLYHRKLSKVLTYAQLKHDEDLANEQYKSAYDRASSLSFDFARQSSFVEPEILAMDKEELMRFINDPCLSDYRFHLQKLIRMQPHVLNEEQEHLLSLFAKPLDSSQEAFGLFTNADLTFSNVVDQSGNSHELTLGQYSGYMQSPDRSLRKDAFLTLHKTFTSFENTICALLNGEIQGKISNAKARKYSSTLQAALYPHKIDPKVYDSLIQAVRDNLPAHHDYIQLRKKALGYDEIHFYDLYNAIVPSVDLRFSFEEAVELVLESLEPMGKEYQSIAENGMRKERWIDRYENKRKRSGAFSGGCYDSMPYILMNYKGYLRDVMTLTHELGHSMHSYFSRKNQPFQYAHYSIFVAEVASTFHEELLFRHLLGKMSTKAEKNFLINQKIDDIRSTLFRQTMFAEFEKTIHEMAEKNIPLIPGALKEKYKHLNLDYFGNVFTYDEVLSSEFLRIPHFYYGFYVYQYATGISASYALVENMLKNPEEGRKRCMEFLSSGGSDYPIDILRKAGVDMTQNAAYKNILQNFGALVQTLKENLDF